MEPKTNLEKQPKYIKGYWRGKRPETETDKPKQDDLVTAAVALAMLAIPFVLLAITFWYVTLSLAGATGLYHGIRYYQSRDREPSLKINYNV